MQTRTRNRHGRSSSPLRQNRQRGRRNNNNNNRSYAGSRSGGRGGSRSGRGRTSSRQHGEKKKITFFNPSQFINKSPARGTADVYQPLHSFSTIGISARLVENLKKRGVSTPSAIQDQVIPEILKGRDVLATAETGTGKTAAFLLPLIETTAHNMGSQTLILTPTRELAQQIDAEFQQLASGLHMFSTVCVGGINIRPQIRKMGRTNHFVVGTPGRILDLINGGHFKPSRVTTLVLDEADRMLDMGFIHDISKIISYTPQNRKTLCFSATTSDKTEQLARKFLINPVTISVKKTVTTDSIEQDIIPHGHHDKFETLVTLLSNQEFKRVIIFGSMKHSVERLAKNLSQKGIKAESIHGNKSQGQRERALAKLKRGEVNILVGTDVAARGIHVDNVSHVINYDLPNTLEDYVHRIGRTGRGSSRGKALTFVQTSTHR